MSLLSDDNKYDLQLMLAKPLYFALFVNVLVPAALLYLCHYSANNYFPENRIGDLANPLFYIFAVVGLLQGVLAYSWRRKLFARPMVTGMDSFQDEMSSALMRACRPISLLVAAISLWGYSYFWLTGRFRETVVLVLLSFVVYQIVRPRIGSLRKLVAYQKLLIEKAPPPEK